MLLLLWSILNSLNLQQSKPNGRFCSHCCATYLVFMLSFLSQNFFLFFVIQHSEMNCCHLTFSVRSQTVVQTQSQRQLFSLKCYTDPWEKERMEKELLLKESWIPKLLFCAIILMYSSNQQRQQWKCWYHCWVELGNKPVTSVVAVILVVQLH